jgi:NAD(P)-dependent dehydrogenase (short-subunit alcohol dehydrogenase family)
MGIGESIATLLAAAGANLVLVSRSEVGAERDESLVIEPIRTDRPKSTLS